MRESTKEQRVEGHVYRGAEQGGRALGSSHIAASAKARRPLFDELSRAPLRALDTQRSTAEQTPDGLDCSL